MISSTPAGEFLTDYLPWIIGIPAVVCLLSLIVMWAALQVVTFVVLRPRGHRIRRWRRADP